MRQEGGSPARSLLSPTLSPMSHACSWPRDASDSPSPTRTFCMVAAIARGLVVSRGSPGSDSLRVGSLRSSRVTSSPSARANCVNPAGRRSIAGPGFRRCCRSNRLPRRKIRDSHAALGDMRLGDRRVLEQIARPVGDFPVEASMPSSTRLSAAAAVRSLNVLHIGNGSSARCSIVAPVPVSRTKTPRRPPSRASMSASRLLATVRRSSVEGAAARTKTRG